MEIDTRADVIAALRALTSLFAATGDLAAVEHWTRNVDTAEHAAPQVIQVPRWRGSSHLVELVI